MSDADNSSFASFGKLVPGFDFLQNLAKQAAGGAAQSVPQMPNLGSWVAPTLNLEELDKRIQELKAVQFWLDQNATALKATIQALELQKMTLATLKGMNFDMADVAKAFKLKVADSPAGSAPRTSDKAPTFSGLEVPPSSFGSAATADSGQAGSDEPAANKAAPAAIPGVVDPLQWWGALTQQFQTIAADAMKDVAKKAAIQTSRNLSTGMAKDAVKAATDMAQGMAGNAGRLVSASTGGSPAPDSAKKPAPKKSAGTRSTAAPARSVTRKKASASASKKAR